MLLPLPGGGAIVDTPGMRELQLWASGDSLDYIFQDVLAIAEQCRFGDCSHGVEPGCAVRLALENGILDTSRWESYRKLQKEVRRHQDQAAEKKKWKVIHKAMRKHPKYNRS